MKGRGRGQGHTLAYFSSLFSETCGGAALTPFQCQYQ
jgi:hypothetical protein